jgi:7-carboxy-7-deazaguanine synthase
MEDSVQLAELFTSIQGESSYSGTPCFFVRLAGCNLDCAYCDTPGAKAGGSPTPVKDLALKWKSSPARIAEITGGEPLLDPGFAALARAMSAARRDPVLVETNGSLDISVIPERCTAIVDVKCPGSGEAGSFDVANIGRLRPRDEVKFVIGSRDDYDWAAGRVSAWGLASRCAHVLFGPVSGLLDAGRLAAWILDDGLPVRLQVQLHKHIGLR